MANNTTERPSEEELSQPVTYSGKGWHGSLAWGSAVKTGQTVGLLHDISHECGMIKNAEDGQLPPQSDLYPANMIGLIAVNADQPEKGAYFARIKKVSSGAFKCVLVASNSKYGPKDMLC